MVFTQISSLRPDNILANYAEFTLQWRNYPIWWYISDYEMPKEVFKFDRKQFELIFVRRKTMYLWIWGSFKSAKNNMVHKPQTCKSQKNLWSPNRKSKKCYIWGRYANFRICDLRNLLAGRPHLCVVLTVRQCFFSMTQKWPELVCLIPFPPQGRFWDSGESVQEAYSPRAPVI
jgi:hypothetical protein